VSVTCEVRDVNGASDSQAITYQIINPTVEEALQKVADNYAKIYDLTADITLTSMLDDQPFGETDYCRYYFKAPDKERTDSFLSEVRATKAEMVIINGSSMYLIDPINSLSVEVDLLEETGIDSSQFNQMDIYYNLANFLNNHTLTQNNAETDFVNLIIAFDAIPAAQNSLYSKLTLFIDYNIGVLMKSYLYKENESGQVELLQTIQAIEAQQLPGGAWWITKMNKIPVLTSGNLIDTVAYSNLLINIGLTDSDFDPEEQY